MKKVCLLTGRPGAGKTSLIKQAISGLRLKAGGFYTEEIRAGGIRCGFRLVSLDGRVGILAHRDIQSPYRVGKYGVDIDELERVGVASLKKASKEADLVVIDEIGKMELLSPSFREVVLKIVNGGRRVLGTIMLTPHPWADGLKEHPLVSLVTVNRTNYYGVLEELRKWLEPFGGGGNT